MENPNIEARNSKQNEKRCRAKNDDGQQTAENKTHAAVSRQYSAVSAPNKAPATRH